MPGCHLERLESSEKMESRGGGRATARGKHNLLAKGGAKDKKKNRNSLGGRGDKCKKV